MDIFMKFARYTAIAAVIFAIQSSPMAQNASANDCTKITASQNRLNCFDGLNKKNTPKKQAPTLYPGSTETKKSGQWVVTVDNVPKIGEKVWVSVEADSEIRSWLVTSRPVLFFRCAHGQSDAYIQIGLSVKDTQETVAGRPASSVTLVSTDGRVHPIQMLHSGDKKSLFFQDAKAMAKILINTTSIALEVPLKEGTSATSVFKTAGLREAIGPHSKTCGW